MRFAFLTLFLALLSFSAFAQHEQAQQILSSTAWRFDVQRMTQELDQRYANFDPNVETNAAKEEKNVAYHTLKILELAEVLYRNNQTYSFAINGSEQMRGTWEVTNAGYVVEVTVNGQTSYSKIVEISPTNLVLHGDDGMILYLVPKS
jgi:hypothetical protein